MQRIRAIWLQLWAAIGDKYRSSECKQRNQYRQPDIGFCKHHVTFDLFGSANHLRNHFRQPLLQAQPERQSHQAVAECMGMR